MSELKRKVVQIVYSPMTEIDSGCLMALCDDGTIWDRFANGERMEWRQVDSPQHARAEAGEGATELEQLRQWKREQLQVESEWDAQEVGRELDLPLGSSIRAGILPAIKRLKAQSAAPPPNMVRIEDALEAVREQCLAQGATITSVKMFVDNIRPRLTPQPAAADAEEPLVRNPFETIEWGVADGPLLAQQPKAAEGQDVDGPAYRVLTLRHDLATECSICGADVVSLDLHDAWHNRLRAIRDGGE